MKTRTLDTEMWLPLGIEQVFGFFSDAGNLEMLTPPWIHFQILTPGPIVLRTGAIIDYQLRIRRVPVRWQSEITVWNPPFQFVDEQLRGPYRRWTHRHDFTEENGGTWIRDHVDYAVHGWLLEPLLDRWLVAPDLRKIFQFRLTKVRELLAPGSSCALDRIAFGI